MGRTEKSIQLTRRERQIMDAVYAAGTATAAEIKDALPDAPSYTTVRTLLSILEQKGHLSHYEDGPRFVYVPVIPRHEMARASLRKVLRTFFDGSLEAAFMSMLGDKDTELSPNELDSLAEAIERARKEGR